MATLEEIQAAAQDPEALQAILAAHVEEEVKGLKTKNGQIFQELESLKPFKALAKAGVKPEELAETLTHLPDLQERAKRAERLETEIAALKAGSTPEDVQKLLDQKLEAERERIRAASAREAEKERTARQEAETKSAELETRLHRERCERQLYRIAGDKVHGDLWDEFVARLLPVLVSEGDDIVVRDPKTGVNLTGKDGDKTLEELVDDLRVSAGKERWDSKGSMFFKTGVGTGDHEGSGSQGSRPPRTKRSEMTTKQKSAYIAKWGRDAFEKLPN